MCVLQWMAQAAVMEQAKLLHYLLLAGLLQTASDNWQRDEDCFLKGPLFFVFCQHGNCLKDLILTVM